MYAVDLCYSRRNNDMRFVGELRELRIDEGE
jgi:hypothetical protein